jgi:periplasmic divalent cation tolerance protein
LKKPSLAWLFLRLVNLLVSGTALGRLAECWRLARSATIASVSTELEPFVNTPVVLVLTTLPDNDAASVLAQQVIEARLAACVTELGVVKSRYRWNGKVEAAEELQLLFKTSLARGDELARFIESNHPYETPEIVSWQADASAAYGQWIIVETQRSLNV